MRIDAQDVRCIKAACGLFALMVAVDSAFFVLSQFVPMVNP